MAEILLYIFLVVWCGSILVVWIYSIYNSFYSLIDTLKTNYQSQHAKQKMDDFHDSEWGKTRKEVFDRDSAVCSRCGFDHTLNVHHKIPLRLGGTNELSNLEVLCHRCHEILHNRKFKNGEYLNFESYGSDNKLFDPTIDHLLKSIKTGDTVNIKYRKNSGEETIRKILPYDVFVGKDHLYLRGFCKLRNEERTFRVDRIVKIIVE